MNILAPLNIMADIETPSTRKNAAILSIAAVAFDQEGNTVGHDFYLTISLQSNLDAGRVVDQDCLCNFWIQKGGDAERKEAFSGTCELLTALNAFESWFKHMERLAGKDGTMWGNGAEFDNGIIEDAFKSFGRSAPWKFWNSKCYRTIKGIYKKEVEIPNFEGKHNALNDAKAQSRHLIQIHKFASERFEFSNSLLEAINSFPIESKDIKVGMDLSKSSDTTTVCRYSPAHPLPFKAGGYVNSVSNTMRQKRIIRKQAKKRRPLPCFVSSAVRLALRRNRFDVF